MGSILDPKPPTTAQLDGVYGPVAQANSPTLKAAFSQVRPVGNGYIGFGDSISTSGPNGAGGAGYGAAWTEMICALSGQRFRHLGNAGVSGNTSAQILARVGDVIAMKPQIVTVLAGTNDLTGSVTFATWSANIKAIATQLRDKSVRVILCTIPPRGNTTYLANQLVWNRWLRAYAQQNNYDLLDFFGLLVDPATGMFAAGNDCGDGVHPSQAAHIKMANYAIAQLQTSAYTPIQADVATDGTNLIANPLLTAGSPTPTSWIVGGSSSADWTNALVTDADFAGKAWQVAFTSAAAATNFRTFTSFQFTGWSVGDVLEVTFKEKVTVSAGITPNPTAGLRFRVDFTGGNPASTVFIGADATVHGVATHTFRFTVPSGTTAMQLNVIVGSIPVGASFTALVGQFRVDNLTTGNLLTA